MYKKLVISLIVLTIFLSIGFLLHKEGIVPNKILQNPQNTVTINGAVFDVDISNTREEIIKGLSDRETLSKSKGMLFVFLKQDIYKFWMKDMNFPIDIIWVDKNFKIVYIKKDASPESYPNIFNPKVNSKYVLEINAGEVDKDKIKIGDSVIFKLSNTKQ